MSLPRLLGGLVAREIAMRRAVVDVTTVVGGDNNSVAAGNGIMDTQHHWQPPRLASDALLLLNAQSGALHCGGVERRVVSEALGL